MDIAVNADVYCTDGFCGHLTCVVLNPATEQVTHVTVQQNGLFSRAWLVPVTHIVKSMSERIDLDLTKKQLTNEMPPFIKTEFLESDLPDRLYTTDLMWPHLITNLEMRTLDHENIPLNQLAVHGGAIVKTVDGELGHLEDFIVNPDDKNVTEIVIRTGRWRAHSRLAIPVSAIDHFDEDSIYLTLNRREAEALASA